MLNAIYDFKYPTREEIMSRMQNPYADHLVRIIQHLGVCIQEFQTLKELLEPERDQAIIPGANDEENKLIDSMEYMTAALGRFVVWKGFSESEYIDDWRVIIKHIMTSDSEVLPTVPSLVKETQAIRRQLEGKGERR